MWGEQVAADAINFEWPTQAMIDQWPADVSLKAITFSTSDRVGSIASVQCTLSTNEQSPLFDTTGVQLYHSKTIYFDANRPVRSVQARDDNSDFIYRVTFADKDRRDIDCYNPNIWNKDGIKTHAIAENEDLIGVYGVRNKEHWFTSFGFMVRVKE